MSLQCLMKCGFSQCAGKRGAIKGLIVKCRKVKSQTQVNWVCGLHLFLAHIKRLLVSSLEIIYPFQSSPRASPMVVLADAPQFRLHCPLLVLHQLQQTFISSHLFSETSVFCWMLQMTLPADLHPCRCSHRPPRASCASPGTAASAPSPPSCKWPGLGCSGSGQPPLLGQLRPLHGEALARMEDACGGLSLLHVGVRVKSLCINTENKINSHSTKKTRDFSPVK